MFIWTSADVRFWAAVPVCFVCWCTFWFELPRDFMKPRNLNHLRRLFGLDPANTWQDCRYPTFFLSSFAAGNSMCSFSSLEQLRSHLDLQAFNAAKVPIIIPMPEGTFERPQDPHLKILKRMICNVQCCSVSLVYTYYVLTLHSVQKPGLVR